MHRWLVTLLVLCFSLGCGKHAVAPVEKKVDLDSDPLALLPGSAVVVATIDAHALLASRSVGGSLASLADRLLPLGSDVGLDAKRDVDRIVLGSYATGSIDVVAVVSGRFDETKLTAARKSRSGGAIVKTMYAGYATFAVGAGVYVVLSSKTVLAGTSEAVRRVLDKVQSGKIERAMPPWAIQTLETPGAEIAIAADFATQPLVAATVGSLRIPWTEGIRVARVVGDFQPPGLHVASTFTYTTSDQASSAADGIRSETGLLKVLGPLLAGISLQNVDVKAQGSDLQCKLAIDDASLGNLLAMGAKLLPAAP
jgi:hypothetical protein